jgi:hypothetical protein
MIKPIILAMKKDSIAPLSIKRTFLSAACLAGTANIRLPRYNLRHLPAGQDND